MWFHPSQTLCTKNNVFKATRILSIVSKGDCLCSILISVIVCFNAGHKFGQVQEIYNAASCKIIKPFNVFGHRVNKRQEIYSA